MSRIPVRIGQENRIKVITAFGAPDIPYLALNAQNLVAGGSAEVTQLNVVGQSEFVGISTFQEDVYFQQDIQVQGNSFFIGNATFYGGTIGIGNSTSDNIIFTGEVDSNIVPNTDNVYNLGSPSQRWNTLHVANLSLSGITTVQAGVGNTYGIAFFGPNSEIVSTATPSVGIQTTNLLLTTNESNIPVWTDSIDGGYY